MGQISSRATEHQQNVYLGDPHQSIVASPGGLSYDKQTELVYDGGDVVTIGNRSQLKVAESPQKSGDFFRALGLEVKTKGSRFSRNALIVVTDFYRTIGSKHVRRNHQQGARVESWQGERGPAEASGAIRVGDTLYAINNRYIVNMTRKQALREICTILENKDFPLILTWKHCEILNSIPWESEESFPPPEGEYLTVSKDVYGKGSKYSSISI